MEKVVLIDCDSLLYKNIEDLGEYQDRIDDILSTIIDKSNASHYKCFLEDFGNYTFRKILNPNYKLNRKDKPLPVNYKEIKQYIMGNYNPYLSKGIETDDSVISTWKYIKNEFPLTDVIISANDKDYLTYPIKYLDLYYGRFCEESEVSKQDAIYNFMVQMLAGDTADGVKCLKGIGKGKAKKLLNNVSKPSKNAYVRLLINEYKKQYKSKYQDKIRFNFNMLWLRSNCRPCKTFDEVEFE